MTDGDFIDELFVGKYPGSSQPRKLSGAQTNAATAAPSPLFDPETWGDPRMKTIGGKPVELYAVGALARALGRKSVTIRRWESQGYIPRPPYRLPGRPGPRGDSGARRYYSRRSIETAMHAFQRHGFLYAVRVDWDSQDAQDMRDEISAAWQQEIAEFLQGN